MFRSSFYTTFFTLVISVGFLQSCAIRAAMNGHKGTLGKKSILPDSINLENNNGILIIPVKIQGKTYRFIYDTGAQISVVSKEIVEQAKLKKKGTIPVSDSQKNKSKLIVTVIPEMQLGNTTFTKIGAAVADFSNNAILACYQVDGIIGMNLLRNVNWLVDFEQERISFYALGSEDSTLLTNYNYFNLHMKTCPFISLNVNDKTEDYLLDLGKSSSLINISSKTPVGDTLQQFLGVNSFGLFGGGKSDTIIYTSGVVAFDSSTVFKKQVLVKAYTEKLSIGTGLLKDISTSLYLDFQHENLYLNLRSIPKSTDISGYGFTPVVSADGQLLVGSVLLTETYPLQLNDTILAINDIQVTGSNTCEVFEEIKRCRKEKRCLNVRVNRGDQNLDFHLELISLVIE